MPVVAEVAAAPAPVQVPLPGFSAAAAAAAVQTAVLVVAPEPWLDLWVVDTLVPLADSVALVPSRAAREATRGGRVGATRAGAVTLEVTLVVTLVALEVTLVVTLVALEVTLVVTLTESAADSVARTLHTSSSFVNLLNLPAS